MNGTDIAPTQVGFYWAKMLKADPGTPDYEGDDPPFVGEFEVVDVFSNSLHEDAEESLRVFVPGIARSQSLGNFEWGPKIDMPASLTSGPTNDLERLGREITTTELGLPPKGTNLNDWIDAAIAKHMFNRAGDRIECVTADQAAEIARGAVLQVIADKFTLIENLRRAGYLVIEPHAFKRTSNFDFFTHLVRQRQWSERTFGPGPRTAGVSDHIRKELLEIEKDPTDITEWIDVVILGLDGAWRAGATPQEIISTLVGKHDKNEARTWPDWRTADPNKAIEHDRSKDA